MTIRLKGRGTPTSVKEEIVIKVREEVQIQSFPGVSRTEFSPIMDFASLLLQENLKEVLQADLFQLGGSAALLGVLLHTTIFRTSICVGNLIYNLLALYAATVISLFYAYFTITVLSPMQALGRVTLLTTSFNISLISSISIYRLFFHRLHPFPGPVACKLTRFYSAFLAAKNIQYNVELKKLHEQYGDFVRTGKLF
ncbi:hypothetical protein BDV36DRAFT_299395 [Aspergillus pseudocaelatus]|uniref:Uncharacterized protein n=1 Tax=Aspergillus pseudocaelatus TaxID=1825620 RepID=A0ABQ6WAD7_9EURO|nr:hypothetical protein BDV36DRAFT_299395 [Aspergillus pseudocaelatus]